MQQPNSIGHQPSPPGYGYADYAYFEGGSGGPGGSGGGTSFLGLSLQRLLRLYWRSLVVVSILVFCLGFLFTLSIPDRYSGTARVVVVANQVGIVNLDAITTGVSGDVASLMSEIELIGSLDVLQHVVDGIGVDGQLRLLTAHDSSQSAADRVESVKARLTDLVGQTSTFAQALGIGREAIGSSVAAERDDGLPQDEGQGDSPLALNNTGSSNLDTSSGWIEDLPIEAALAQGLSDSEVRRRATDLLRTHLSVQQVGRSRVIEITMQAPEPRLAADLANRIANAYRTTQIQAKLDTARQANLLLTTQMGELRAQISAQESEIEAHREKTGLTNADAALLAAQRVEQLNDTLTNARAELAAVQARKSEAGAVQTDRNLLEATADVLDSTFVEELRLREIELEREASTLRDKLLPDHPELVRVNREIAQLRERINQEVEKIVQSISSDENTLVAEIGVLERTLLEADEVVVRLNRAERQIEAMSMEMVANRTLLETFVARSRETAVQEGFQQADAQIIESAQVNLVPSGPNRMIWLTLCFVAGFGTALGTAITREISDPRVRQLDAIQAVTEAKTLAVIPDLSTLIPRKKGLLSLAIDGSRETPIADVMRRAYLKLSSSIETSKKSSDPESDVDTSQGGVSILVTSSRPDEGKTSLACLLALIIGKFGKNVVIIDADLRKPSIGQALGVKHESGVVDFLSEEAGIEDLIHADQRTGLHYMVRGSQTGSPVELINTPRFQLLLTALTECYDYVIVDSAPVLAAPETREIARHVDQVVYVLNWSVTKRSEFANAFGELAETDRFEEKTNLILNQIPRVEMRFLEAPKTNYLEYEAYGNYG